MSGFSKTRLGRVRDVLAGHLRRGAVPGVVARTPAPASRSSTTRRTTWVNDPAEDLVLLLMTQRARESHLPPAICRDFWTAAYQALDD